MAAAADCRRVPLLASTASLFYPLGKASFFRGKALLDDALSFVLSLPSTSSSSIRSFLAAFIEFLLLCRYFLPSSSLSQDRLVIKMLSRNKKSHQQARDRFSCIFNLDSASHHRTVHASEVNKRPFTSQAYIKECTFY